MFRVLMVCLCIVVLTTSAFAEPALLAPLSDPASALAEQQRRTEAHEDRIEAAAQLGAGRVLLHREDLPGALRRFQRAWRFAPSNVAVLRDIVSLSFHLNHREEAARYAVIQAELAPQDADVLRELAGYLAAQGELERALGLFEKAVQISGEPRGLESLQLHRRMGRLYFLTDQHKKAADAFAVIRDALQNPEKFGLTGEEAKEFAGKSGAGYVELGEAFFAAERYDEAEAMFVKAHKADPNAAMLAFRQARLAAKRGQTEKAARLLKESFDEKLSEAGLEPYELLAELIEKQTTAEDEASRRLLERLQELHADDSQNQQLAAYYVQQLLQAGKLDTAEKICRKMLQERLTGDAYRGLIEVYRRRGDTQQLLDTLGEAVDKGRSLSTLGDEADAILSEPGLLDRLIEAARNRSNAADALAEGTALAVALLAMEGEAYDAADDFFALAADKAIKDRKGEVCFSWGLEMLLADQYERAAHAFQRAIDKKVSPDQNALFYYQLAGALQMLGRTEEALKAARRAAELEPDDPRYRSRIAWIKFRAKRYEEAKADYLAILEEFDDDWESSGVRETMRDVRITLSTISLYQDDLDQAVEWLHQALDEFPEDPGALNDLGYLWADENVHLQRALGMIERAARAEPDNPAYLDSLGWVHFRLGNYPEAVKHLEKAVALEEQPDAVILDHLGDAYFASGEKDKARTAWKRAAEAFREDADEEHLEKVQAKLTRHF